MAEKKTVMVLNVDLKCPCCYKKIQKILCKIPQIRDRIFDLKENKVIITVICCSPEKIRDKLLCKGGKTIKSIEEPPKPKDDKPKDDKPKDNKPKDDKPKDNKPKDDKPKDDKQKDKPKDDKPKDDKPKDDKQKDDKPKDDKPKDKPPVHPVNPCCGPCYAGYGSGPCYHGYGFPAPPTQPCYDGYYGPEYVYGRPCYVSRCDYFSEENPTACTIM